MGKAQMPFLRYGHFTITIIILVIKMARLNFGKGL